MRALADADRIQRFMRRWPKRPTRRRTSTSRAQRPSGSAGVRAQSTSTSGFEPDCDAISRAIARLKDELHINVELASPVDFIPVKPGWEDWSPFVATEGPLTFHHFDLYAQALAKVSRGHTQDLADVREMIRRGLVDPSKALDYFGAIEPRLYRYPALDPEAFRAAVAREFSV